MFRKFKRIQIAELREVTETDIHDFQYKGAIKIEPGVVVSVSSEDKINGSPKLGDMIARNPKNNLDQWLVSEQYFEDNFEVV